jgi:hypothetical protein
MRHYNAPILTSQLRLLVLRKDLFRSLVIGLGGNGQWQDIGRGVSAEPAPRASSADKLMMVQLSNLRAVEALCA